MRVKTLILLMMMRQNILIQICHIWQIADPFDEVIISTNTNIEDKNILSWSPAESNRGGTSTTRNTLR